MSDMLHDDEDYCDECGEYFEDCECDEPFWCSRCGEPSTFCVCPDEWGDEDD